MTFKTTEVDRSGLDHRIPCTIVWVYRPLLGGGIPYVPNQPLAGTPAHMTFENENVEKSTKGQTSTNQKTK